MAIEWSDDIIIANLSDEPALSEELSLLVQRAEVADPDKMPSAILNCNEVTYLNSSNIAQLLRLRTLLSGAERRLKLCSVTDQVWSVFMVTGLDKVFDFNQNPAEAIASLQIDGG